MKLITLAFALLVAASALHAQSVPQLVNYQGRVAVGTVNFNGTGQFKFALVNTNGSITYWSNDGSSTAGSQPYSAIALTVTKGLYSVLLGDTSLANMTAIPASVWANADVRLRVWFNDSTNGSQLLTPDQRLAPNGYLPDGSVSSAKIAIGAVGSAQLAAGAVTSANLASGASAPPVIVSGASQTAVANASYVATSGTLTTIVLPTTANLGDTIKITGQGAGGWRASSSQQPGVIWEQRRSSQGSSQLWTGIAASSDGSKLVAVAGYPGGGQIYTSADFGDTWTAHEINRSWTSVASSSDGTKLVAVDSGLGTGLPGGRIYTSTDAGLSWSPYGPTNAWLSVASSADGNKLVAVEQHSVPISGGRIYISTDAGLNWTARGPTNIWVGVASSADGTKLVACGYTSFEGGLIYTSTDSGLTWTKRAITAMNCRVVASSADGTKLVVISDQGQIYTSVDSGVSWTTRESVRSWASVASSADGSTLVALARGGQIYVSTDS